MATPSVTRQLDSDSARALGELREHTRNRSEQWAIFLGAGASAALGFPTMLGLVDRLRTCLTREAASDVLIASVLDALQQRLSQMRPPRAPNIEDILGELYQLLELLTGKPLVTISYGDVRSVTPELASEAARKVKQLCEEYCQGLPKSTALADFLRYWMTANRIVSVFTTNWDRNVEYACDDILAADEYDVRLCDGFKGQRIRIFDSTLFAETPGDASRRETRVVKLYKLHGSVDWNVRSQPREGSNIRSTFADIDEGVMIFPTPRKHGEILGPPYLELHRLFADCLASSSRYMLAIGTSFPDEHINTVVANALRDDRFNLFVVDPSLTKSDIEAKLRFQTPRIHHAIHLPFGSFVDELKKGG
jgi:hypothetical protein